MAYSNHTILGNLNGICDEDCTGRRSPCDHPARCNGLTSADSLSRVSVNVTCTMSTNPS